MCGIAGILGESVRSAVESMLASMRARGPDDAGVYEDAHVVLGLRRLSILDLTQAGHQPMSRADGRLWIVYNGEIYNHRELRRELEGRGHHFRSRTDTEVVLALYEEMGTDCVSRLRGMFGFAIWDRRTTDPVLFLARDHFGIKPLVYSSTSRPFVFASDIPAMLASGTVAADIDRVALAQYMTYGHVIQPRTILKDVHMLPAAHAMTVRPGENARMWRYWDFDHALSAANLKGMSFEERAAHLRDLLTASARRQIVSDVPVGAFLSSGCDSSSLVALMMQISGRPVHTVSVGFDGGARDLDESEDARRSAIFLGAAHRDVQVTHRDVTEVLPDLARYLGQPTIDGLNMYFASRAASSEVKVVTVGIGADELFAGYTYFRDLHRSWNSPRRIVARRVGVGLGRTGLWKLLPHSAARDAWERRASKLDLRSHYAVSHMIRTPTEMVRLIGLRTIDRDELFPPVADDDPGVGDIMTRVSKLDVRRFLCSQLLRDMDAASMACSLEARVPFLDLDVVEFAYGLPCEDKVGPLDESSSLIGKRLFIHAVRDLIPDWTYRRPKRGFMMPYLEWLKGPLRPLVGDILADRLFRTSGLLDPKELERFRARFESGAETRWTAVWSLMMLGLWLRTFTVDRGGSFSGDASRSSGIPASCGSAETASPGRVQ